MMLLTESPSIPSIDPVPLSLVDQTLRAALIQLARSDFWVFVELMFPILHPGQKLDRATYLELLASTLMRVQQGKFRRLLINLPPRHMKSMVTSVLYSAWVLGLNPTAKLICISYSDDLAHHLSRLTRTVMRSGLYKEIFPGTILDKVAEDQFTTTKGGLRYATAVGSVITGFGANTIIIDDPLQPEDALSELKKSQFRDWLQNSVMTRFDRVDTGVLILVMHRLAQDDPSREMLDSAAFKLVLPLVAEKEELYSFNGRVIHHRKPGDILSPLRFSQETVAKIRREAPNYVFASQYQQRPTIGGSGMLNIEHWVRYESFPLKCFELVIQSWDIGATINGNASVCTTWGLYKIDGKDVICLVDVKRLKLELPEVQSAIKAADAQYKPALVVIDENGVGLGVLQHLYRSGYKHVLPSRATKEGLELPGDLGHRPSASKIDRFGKAILEITDGRVLIPIAAPWLDSFLSEVAGFPNIPDKDQVDSLSQIAGNLNHIIHLARRFKSQRGM